MGDHHLRRVGLLDELKEDAHGNAGERIGLFPSPGQDDFPRRLDAFVGSADHGLPYAADGIKPPKEDAEIDLPEELVEAMDADPELAEAFNALALAAREATSST